MKNEVKLRTLDNITVTVTVTRELRLRMWIGLALIKAGVRVMGCGLHVESAGDTDVPDA